MEFRWLSPEEYRGYPLRFRYVTDRVYDVNCRENGFLLEETPLPAALEKSVTDELFASWLEEPVALGAFQGDTPAGIVEGSREAWHDVFRISSILVEEPFRRRGLGGELLERMVAFARELPGCRGVILETQTCNYPAICFYRKHGFTLSRIDIREYSNEDIQNREARIDLFRPFPKSEDAT